jgi:hypothetical protein
MPKVLGQLFQDTFCPFLERMIHFERRFFRRDDGGHGDDEKSEAEEAIQRQDRLPCQSIGVVREEFEDHRDGQTATPALSERDGWVWNGTQHLKMPS